MKNNEIIFPDDERAATFQTNISGWVSRNGMFYGNDEELARSAGATAIKCQSCGEPTQNKYHLLCEKCKAIKEKEKYFNFPEKEYCGGMVYSDHCDRYFNDLDEAIDFAETEEIEVEDLKLLHCEPIYLTEINPYEHYEDDAPEDEDDYLPKEIVEAFSELNEKIRNCKVPISYFSVNIRIKNGKNNS